MLNYEELYKELIIKEKELKDSVKAVDRMFKAIQKDTENGNLTDMKKQLGMIAETAKALSDGIENVNASVDSFDTKEYFVSGDFTRQLLTACEERGIDVKGEKGVYEMFPYKVRIYGDEEHAEEVNINRKKVPSFRPSEVARQIKEGQEKMYRANFRADAFMNELSEAYDVTLLKNNSRPGATLTLQKIYKTLTPMARARKEYDMQAFAFDLARIYELGTEAWVDKNGRHFFFGTSRDGKNGIRVLSSTGVESYIVTLRVLLGAEE